MSKQRKVCGIIAGSASLVCGNCVEDATWSILTSASRSTDLPQGIVRESCSVSTRTFAKCHIRGKLLLKGGSTAGQCKWVKQNTDGEEGDDVERNAEKL